MPKKILIVDDAAFMRMMLRDILNEAGYEIAGEAEDGKDVVSKYRELRPDLVTMDIIMRETDGITALKDLMKEDADALVLVVSAIGQQALTKEAIEAGARGYIVKPFKPEKIIEEVKRILG
ncbi:MAG: response regulator [Pseudomonadota bacterium]